MATNCAPTGPDRAKPWDDSAAWSDDAALGGSLRLLQPRRGHRFGHDAILLAAATPARAGDCVVELGAGVGAAGLALARRVPGLRLTLVEIDPDLAAAARENAARNGLGPVDVVVLDVAAPAALFAAVGPADGSADHVLMNPPFYDSARHSTSPDPGRRRAHTMAGSLLRDWMRTAGRLLRPGGTLTLIWPAGQLDDVWRATDTFGAAAVLPIHGRPGTPAIRILVRLTKARRGPVTLWPGLLLNDDAGRPTGEAEAVLRQAAPLRLGDETQA